jgi:hypothetical protein
MPRRSQNDSLKPVDRLRWLVTRNALRQPVSAVELAAGTDLRAVLTAARDVRVADGWITEVGRLKWAIFFCARDGVRLEVGIEAYDPYGPGHQSHSAPG